MPIKKMDLNNVTEVLAYTEQEATAIAARTIARSGDDFGTFAMGVMIGMSIVDKVWGKVPQANPDISKDISFGCVSQAAFNLKADYDKLKGECLKQELERGSDWVEGKKKYIETLLTAGAEINERINQFMGKETEKAIKHIEELMADELQGEFDKMQKEKKDGGSED